MAFGDTLLEKADAFLINLFSGWNNTTTAIATIVLLYVVYPWLTWQDPDTHPLLLARQATASPVRNKGESAVYRSVETPYGYPLRSGLNVKDPGAPKWSQGRTGDLRDIWRQAVQGPLNDDGTLSGKQGKLLTVLGREQVLDHAFEDVSRNINIIGQHIKSANGSVVAICLSNSMEMLSAIFACAFYGVKAVLVSHNLATEDLIAHLSLVKPDFLIAEAGAVEIAQVGKSITSLTHIIWVAKYGSRHMDWNEVPEGVGGRIDASVWHEMVDDNEIKAGIDLPASEEGSTVSPVSAFIGSSSGPKVIEYSSENIVAAVAAQISALPRQHRLSTSDIVLPADTLCSIYTLTLVFTALYSGSSVALNSVAGNDIDMRLVATGISPTVIITSSGSLANYHEKVIGSQKGFITNLNHTIQSQSLDAGNMPKPTSLSKLVTGGTAGLEPSFANLRLIYAYLSTESSQPGIPSQVLSDLRVILGARIIYALTTPSIAGAITQTNLLDYRRTAGANHFGGLVSSVEIKLVDDERLVSKDIPEGKICVAGPAVVGRTTSLDIRGNFGVDGTLSLA